MHIYLYDYFLGAKRYDQILARIETRITDLGLNGKIIRLGVANSVFDAIENEIKKGAKTITAVGNDSLFNRVIDAMAKLAISSQLNKDVPIGFIPVGKKNNEIAKFIGLPPEEEACDILSARRIQRIDLGLANNNYFLSRAAITTKGTTVEIDKDYSIEIMEPGEICVVNLPIDIDLPETIKPKVDDGVMELLIRTGGRGFVPVRKNKNAGPSVFSFNSLKILNKSHPVILDNSTKVNAPVRINVALEKINLIVGRDRMF